MLRAVPDKLLGVVFMGSAVLLPFFLPWLDRCRVKSIRYRSWIHKLALAVFVVSFLSLGYLGMQQPTGPVVVLCRIFTILYFAFFFSMPFYSRVERTKPVPTRVTP
jgi:ubiquinol-cytochrome c reductase cytochrome b subunit